PVANNLIHFAISGPGKIIGVGNGDPICHEPDVYFDKQQIQDIPLDDWRMSRVSNTKRQQEVAENFDDSGWKPVNVRAESGPLTPGESAVYRAHFSVTKQDLALSRINVSFGMIDDEGWIYVNGRRVGQSRDWENDPSFDIGRFLHPGNNALAVEVKNDDGDGGINKGVTLEFEKSQLPADWRRSAFNGLAEVIVQADKNAGEIKLTARANGLAPATIAIQTKSDSVMLAAP
ncbi:MAG: sugar-binding domain-containing protein, partial [Limisphaerales bacterium]